MASNHEDVDVSRLLRHLLSLTCSAGIVMPGSWRVSREAKGSRSTFAQDSTGTPGGRAKSLQNVSY